MFLLLAWLTTNGFLPTLGFDPGVGQKLCVGFMPQGDWSFLYSALLCGTDLPPGRERQLFTDSGLIHVMVVSGSHLVFIEMLIGFVPSRARLWVLGVYTFLVGFQPPIMRAFLRRLIGPELKKRIGFSALQLEAATAVVALSLYPMWIESRSFLMSWMCAIAINSPKVSKAHPLVEHSLKCYLFMLPFCWASPMSIFWNVILAPAVGLILFPACLVTVVLPPFQIVSDGLWSLFLQTLHLGPLGAPWSQIFIRARSLLWIPALTHIAMMILEVRWRRESAFSSS